ncbi:hypothetical protein [Thermoflexus sp.]|uniref:hypothetical protein n=1 Tax=Thermoflexus sp. TaxID=1969742 RepID=UPI0035E40D36
MRALTRRQREFLAAFLRLYRRWRKPLHYGAVARALRIGQATAYEMLALLERVGLVERQYAHRAGPGRPRVMFRPTVQAHRVLSGLWEARIWRATRIRLWGELQGLQARMDPATLLQWLLSIPMEGPVSEGMARMAAGLMLVFRLLQQGRHEGRIFLRGRALDLGALAGLSAALVALSRAEPHQVQALMARIRWFQEQWDRLDPLDRRRLSQFAHQILRETAGIG